MKSDNKLKPNETKCFYCGNIIDRLRTKKRNFCSNECRIKYWKGVYKKLWKEGDLYINPSDKPVIKFKKEMKGGKK